MSRNRKRTPKITPAVRKFFESIGGTQCFIKREVAASAGKGIPGFSIYNQPVKFFCLLQNSPHSPPLILRKSIWLFILRCLGFGEVRGALFGRPHPCRVFRWELRQTLPAFAVANQTERACLFQSFRNQNKKQGVHRPLNQVLYDTGR